MSVIVIFGPSGVGKTTLINKLLKEYLNKYSFSVSHTTRTTRVNEKNGKDYYFIDEELFLKMIKDNEFLEWTNFNGKYYGTSYKSVSIITSQNKICILDLDLNGVKNLQTIRFFKNIKYIRILPPSIDELSNRLLFRDNNTDRLELSIKDIDLSNDVYFDETIINDDIDKSYNLLKVMLNLI